MMTDVNISHLRGGLIWHLYLITSGLSSREQGSGFCRFRTRPQESVGRHLLLAYLDEFVRRVGGMMHIEVQTGRGRMDLLITHNQRKYIVETKIWRGEHRYQSGKQQLAAYLKLEGVTDGYYVVFDHRQTPDPRIETETLEGVVIRSYVIPVIQETPSNTIAPKT